MLCFRETKEKKNRKGKGGAAWLLKKKRRCFAHPGMGDHGAAALPPPSSCSVPAASTPASFPSAHAMGSNCRQPVDVGNPALDVVQFSDCFSDGSVQDGSVIGGMGFRRQVEPAGLVPVLTSTGVKGVAVVPSLYRRKDLVPGANGNGVSCMHASVSSAELGQILYW